MLRLLLIRHAEAAAHAPGGDLARSLTARGVADAARVGAYCRRASLIPDFALVSPALRARDTLETILREIPQKSAWEIEDLLYGADIETLREILERIPAPAKTLLIVGHNPGLVEFARFLVRNQKGSESLRQFPAPCLALIQFPCSEWIDAEAAGGRLDLLMNFSCVPAEDLLSE
ncbi:MAG TPA: histidine phosphatase family protein [Methylocella sp.]|nr:histidine phosphatase family protein [Methylocella sp.]